MPGRLNWTNKWALVAGGTSGLGLAIAKQMARRGANVAVIGRNADRVMATCEMLKVAGASDTNGFAVDLSQQLERSEPESARLVEFCEHQSLKLCVAAIGKSDRGYLADLSAADLQHSIASNVVSALQTSQLAAKSLARNCGSLVHIASISGLAAASGLGAYSLSKSALVAMSRQMRQEWKPKGVYVTLVCCGPIAREDSGSRYDELAQQRALPEHLKQAGGGVRLEAIDPVVLAEQIIAAALQHKPELVVPNKVRMLASIAAFFPSFADSIIEKSFNRKTESH